MSKNTLGIISFVVLVLTVMIGGVYYTNQVKKPTVDSSCIENQKLYLRELFYKKNSQGYCTEHGQETETCLELTSRYEAAKKKTDPYKDECLDSWNRELERIDPNNVVRDVIE